LDSFRTASAGDWLPTRNPLTNIAHILKGRVQESLPVSCSVAKYVNLVVDGWLDPPGRRYQGLTARFVEADPTTSVHERAAKLMAMIRCVQFDRPTSV
jgi:hypothetical protein